MMVTATSTFATARTLELLTNSGLSGWNVDKGSWANLHHEASGFDSIWFFPNDPNRESWSTLSQTVNLPDFGIAPGSGLSVSASVVAFSEWNGYPVCNVQIYQLDANGATQRVHTVVNRPNEEFTASRSSIEFPLDAAAVKLKYEINGQYVKDPLNSKHGPAFQGFSLAVSFDGYLITFVSEGATSGKRIFFTGDAAEVPTAPTLSRNGYRFLGYFTDASGGVQVYDGSFGYVSGGGSGWTPTSDATLYARWEPVAITFKSEDATVGTATYSEEGMATAPVPTRSGDYTFLGYFTENGRQVYDRSGALVQGSLSGLSSNTTLYARWAAPEGSVARLVYRGQLTKLGKDEPAGSDDKFEKKMHFRVYDGESAETPIWKVDNQTVTVNRDGSFVATFGDETLAELIATGSVSHVGIAIGDSGIELTPRRALRPVAAVNRALVAEAASKDVRIGNLVTENALAANNVSISQLEVYGTVTAPGAGPVEVSPIVVGEKETLTLLRGDGVKVFSNSRIDLGEVASVLRGQKLKEAPADGIALVSSSKSGSRGLRIPGVIQYCRKGDWVRAPASEPDGVKVTFFPFVGK